jgi:hypothetical protein
MPWIDPDKTPIYLPTLASATQRDANARAQLFEATEADIEHALDRLTPSLPLPLTRRVDKPRGSSWDPPPLRKLLESAPPPPRLPMRSAAELACALATPGVPNGDLYGLAAGAPAFAVTSSRAIDWDTSLGEREAMRSKRRVAGWLVVGTAYALGLTVVAGFALHERDEGRAAAAAQTAREVEHPTLSKQASRDQTALKSAVALQRPVRIVGYVTDPPSGEGDVSGEVSSRLSSDAGEEAVHPEHQQIDLDRLRVVVAAKAAQASGCRDRRASVAQVAITFAPSGHATQAMLMGGQLEGTEVGSCIRSVMRSSRVAPFAGEPTIVTETVRLDPSKKR